MQQPLSEKDPLLIFVIWPRIKFNIVRCAASGGRALRAGLAAERGTARVCECNIMEAGLIVMVNQLLQT